MGDASDCAPRLGGVRADLRLCAVRDGSHCWLTAGAHRMPRWRSGS